MCSNVKLAEPPSVRSFLNVTTDKVYENKEWEYGYRENDPLDGYDPYSNSKSCSELVTHSYQKSFFQDGRCAISTSRAGNVIGGGDFANDRIIPDCIRAAAGGQGHCGAESIFHQTVSACMKMLLLSLSSSGELYFDGLEPDFHTELALTLDEDEELVRDTLEFLMRVHRLEQKSETVYYLPEVGAVTGSESASAERMRKARQKPADAKPQEPVQAPAEACNTEAAHCDTPAAHCDVEKEIEKELEIEKETESDAEKELFPESQTAAAAVPETTTTTGSRKKRTAFSKPTLEEIRNYCMHRGSTVSGSRTEDLVKKYGKRTVVSHVSIDVKQGEIVGLLGPNGAGKTTSFYMTVGLITPNEGRIFLDDLDITKYPVYKRAQTGIGYLAQEASVFRQMSVEDNIASVLEMTDKPLEYQKEKLESLIAEFRLQKVRKNKGNQLSGGERRRTEIARCLAIDPKFIMLDEPFAGVDPIAVEDIQQIVWKLKDKNIGILITDHNVQETLSITDRAYLLFEGKIFVSREHRKN